MVDSGLESYRTMWLS